MITDLDKDPLIDNPTSIDQIGTLAPKRQCWWVWSHEWSEWEDVETGTIERMGNAVGRYIYQERRCNHCNKVEMNQIKI